METRNESNTVTIDVAVLDGLQKDSEFLQALYAAGVDNWDGYEYALDLLNND